MLQYIDNIKLCYQTSSSPNFRVSPPLLIPGEHRSSHKAFFLPVSRIQDFLLHSFTPYPFPFPPFLWHNSFSIAEHSPSNLINSDGLLSSLVDRCPRHLFGSTVTFSHLLSPPTAGLTGLIFSKQNKVELINLSEILMKLQPLQCSEEMVKKKKRKENTTLWVYQYGHNCHVSLF